MSGRRKVGAIAKRSHVADRGGRKLQVPAAGPIARIRFAAFTIELEGNGDEIMDVVRRMIESALPSALRSSEKRSAVPVRLCMKRCGEREELCARVADHPGPCEPLVEA